MSSKAKKKEGAGEPLHDLEQQFILRLPPGSAMALRREVQSGSMTLKDRISIELNQDHRHGAVRYGTDIFHAKLMDLPCVIESYKTIDNKTAYKTADLCQMLLCTNDEEPMSDENDSLKKKDKDKKYQYIHGITPPLKNVKKRRFRKTLKKKYMEQPDIEKEVKRLFRQDAEAIDVKWELITEEEKVSSSQAKGGSDKPLIHRSDTTTSLDYAIFGELSSSDEDDEKDVNIMDSGEDEMSRSSSFIPRQTSYASLDMANSESQDAMNDTESAELAGKLTELKRQVEEIRRRRQSQEDRVATLENPMLKQTMQEMLNKTIKEEDEKGKEFEILSSMLG
ncbi:transcription initiation factor TFIID subunit 7 [Mytilus galloprovincialis]|uniref:Transcription initiation factor TFIID subunit 7 n=1 Tax=Mytilus galloprovincialis TaxID=29158 RepID=A0A8B6BW06_MYTGA|nr:transcription initiation factor TFIID subunit 7 [Mytilus galloprovincialis]